MITKDAERRLTMLKNFGIFLMIWKDAKRFKLIRKVFKRFEAK